MRGILKSCCSAVTVFVAAFIALSTSNSAVYGQYFDLGADNVNGNLNVSVTLNSGCVNFDNLITNAFISGLNGHQIGVLLGSTRPCGIPDCCWPSVGASGHWCKGYSSGQLWAVGDGFLTQEVRIKYAMWGSGGAKDPNGYDATEIDAFTFSVTLLIQGAPPGFPLDVYASWRHFGGIGNIDGGDNALTNAQLNIGPWGNVLNGKFNFDSSVISGFNRQRGDLPMQTMFNGNALTITFIGNGNATAGPPNPGAVCANTDKADFNQSGEVVIRIGAQPVLSLPDTLNGGIAGVQSIEFSVDIGSDAEKSDPTADSNEVFDPGDAYVSSQVPLPSCGADGSRDDNFYQGFDCFPNAPDCPVPASTRAPVGSGFPLPLVESSFGDMDGLDNLDVQLEQFLYGPGTPGIGYFLSTCINDAEYLYVSYEDDSPELFTNNVTPSVPVNSQPAYVPQTYSTEIFGLAMWGGGVYPKSPAMEWNYLTESQLHINLAPNPTGSDVNDDDVDAIDIRDNTCSEWYFSLDHEAHGCVAGLNPGAIYRATNAGPVLIVDPQIHLGLPFGTDMQDFEFTWLSGLLPPFAYTSLALLYTVDEDDPATLGDESGGLDPAMIYWSLLDGMPPQEVLLTGLENPIDGLASWSIPLMAANVNPQCQWDYAIPVIGQPTTINGILDATDDCPLSPLADHIVRVDIPYADNWSFSMCRTQGNPNFRMYLMENCCGGNQLAFNEDFCWALPAICVYLQQGTYYLIIEGPYNTPYTLRFGPCSPPQGVNCTFFEPSETVNLAHFFGQDPDGGCDLTLQGFPAVFSPANCGSTICGGLFNLTDILNGVTYSDIDWYHIPLPSPSTVTICATSNIDLHITVYPFPNGPCVGGAFVSNYSYIGAGQEVCVPDTLQSNCYIRVTPNVPTAMQDSTVYNYELFVECVALPCLAPEQLVISRTIGQPNSYDLRFNALQAGNYTVYRTTAPNINTIPPAPGWVSVGTLTVAGPGSVTTTLPSEFADYSKYAVARICP